jgi:hypothetical protein
MNLLDQAKNIVCGIIAVALAMSVAAVEALLPRRPDWLERIDALAIQLRTISKGDEPKTKAKPAAAAASKPGKTEPPGTPEMDADRLLLAYNQLWQFAHAVRSDGLALDDKFCHRVEQEWTVSKLLSFMRSADRSLQDRAGNSLESASTFLAAAASGNETPS